MFSGDATNINFIIFGLIQSELELTIYFTWWEHTNNYNMDVGNQKSIHSIVWFWTKLFCIQI